MTHTRKGDTVTLEMTVDDWENLLLMIGSAAGSVYNHDKVLFWHWIRFANEINQGNPRFTPYEIPEEFQRKQGSKEPRKQ